MKTIKYILILFCATVGLFAQDREPQPMEFIWGTKDYPRVFDPKNSQFQQKEFLIGTQWGQTPKYYIGMNHNAAAGRFLKHELDNMYEKPITTIYQPTLDWWFIAFRISPAMHYDPALSVEALINPDTLINDTSIAKDPTFSVFGFKERGVSSIQTIDNNRRLKINRNVWGVYNPSGNKILSGISEQPNFRTEFCISSQNEGLFGHRWFLSVNMRKLSNTDSIINHKLITIKIKYYTHDDSNNVVTSYINFDSIPEKPAEKYEYLPFGRGKQQLKRKVNYETKEFVVNNGMFESINEDKTFTASFLTLRPSDGNEYFNKPYLINPEFPPGHRFGKDYSDTLKVLDAENLLNPINYANVWQKPMPCIDSLDIEVYYHNAEDIAIDYIKIESENAYYMSRGYVDAMPNIQDSSKKYVHVIGDYNYKDSLSLHNRDNMPYNIWARPFAIKETMQGWLNNEENSATIYGTNTKLRQALRFYIQDTESEKPHFWWQLRYANLITNGLSVTRDLPYKHKLYRYYTKSKNKYIGIKIQENESMNALPFIKKGHQGNDSLANIPYYLGYKYGYSDIPAQNPYLPSDTVAPLITSNNHLYSNYETALAYWVPSYLQEVYDTVNSRYACRSRLFDIIRHLELKIPDEFEIYNGIANSSSSIQINWEYSLRDKFYNHQDMLYSDDAWWMNYFLGGEYYEKQYSNPNIKLTRVHCGRFKTGEETRLLLYGSILKGAKGFFYDRECDALYNSPEEGKAQIIGLCVGDSIKALVKYQNYGYYPDDYTPFNQYKSILSDTVGNDFYFCGQDPAKMETDSIKSKKSNIASTLGVAEDRIYLGMRSTRTEVYKISQLIRRLEQNKRRNPYVYLHDLMDLRLVAWYGKGFTEMYSQHPNYNNGDLMNEYIDKSSIRTAKLYQANTNGYFQNVDDTLGVNHWESLDSSFFDVTILTPQNESILNLSSYYIGIQNRRTDPLIWDSVSQKMKFYSTAEFEDGCHCGDSATRKYFRDCFWKRLGCRLLSFKVNRLRPNPKKNFCYSFQIREILAQDSAFNDTNSRWRGDEYCHKINFYIPSSNSNYNPEIMVKLLPGEGKLLQVRHYNNIYYNDNYKCPRINDIYLNYELVKDEGDSLVYDVEFVNNTDNSFNIVPILYRFSRNNLNINFNDFVIHSNLHPDYYDENRLTEVSILGSIPPQSRNQIARIKVGRMEGLPELFYSFDLLTKNNEPCYQVFINTNNHIVEYQDYEGMGKKVHKGLPEIVNILEVNPNPANDKLIVSFASSEVSSYNLRIYDINGSVVYSYNNSTSSIGANELTLDISTLPVGVYSLSLEINNEQISRKFSINR